MQLRPLQEDSVEHEHGVRRRLPDGCLDGGVGTEVEDCRSVTTVATRPERLHERAPERVVVERILVVAACRVRPLAIAIRAGAVEAVDRRPDDLPRGRRQSGGEFVREDGLARGIGAVDRDAGRMSPLDGENGGGEPLDQLVA